jgi:uncharacterized protein YcaQ
MATTTVSLAAIRRLAVSTQAYASRFRRARGGEVEETIRRLGAVQLDSISAVDRAHRLTLSSRIGAYPETELQELLASGRVFEYWGARGLPPPHRALATLPAHDGGRRALAVPRAGDAPAR